jgi:hypothetical protein
MLRGLQGKATQEADWNMKQILWKLCGFLGAASLIWAFYSMALEGLKRVHVLAALGFFVLCLLFAAVYAAWISQPKGR